MCRLVAVKHSRFFGGNNAFINRTFFLEVIKITPTYPLTHSEAHLRHHIKEIIHMVLTVVYYGRVLVSSECSNSP